MKNGPSKQDILWMVAGAAIFVAIFVVIWFFRQDPAQALASRSNRAELVGRIQAALYSASEAEKSAVLAVTDGASQGFAEQARAATAEAERGRQELGKLLEPRGTQPERALLAQFSEAFTNLQRVDDEVLRLAGKNTNVKAYALAFGPAADALGELDAALARVAGRGGEGPDARRRMQLADSVRLAVLRIQALLPPHIAEAGDARMDQLEARMAAEEQQGRKGLRELSALPGLGGDPDLAIATARFAAYVELKGRILALSRENSNVQSLALLLNQKRTAMIPCLEALASLKQVILEEPIPGVSYGRLPTR